MHHEIIRNVTNFILKHFFNTKFAAIILIWLIKASINRTTTPEYYVTLMNTIVFALVLLDSFFLVCLLSFYNPQNV